MDNAVPILIGVLILLLVLALLLVVIQRRRRSGTVRVAPKEEGR